MPKIVHREMPSQNYLREILDYDPETGLLTWRHRQSVRSQWNSRYAGKPALASATREGHLRGAINNVRYLTHRIVWKWWHGTEPIQIDHINGDPADNRIENLRSVTNAENCRNHKLRSTNSTGVMGVRWNVECRKWQARISIESRTVHLGLYTSFEDAVAARRAAEKANGFHQNHGRKAA